MQLLYTRSDTPVRYVGRFCQRPSCHNYLTSSKNILTICRRTVVNIQQQVYEQMKGYGILIPTPILLVILLIGVVLVLFGIFKSSRSVQYRKGIWFTGIGTVLTVLVLLLITGWNNTAYYPSNIDLQSSLTLANSCSSEFTLRTMAIVSLLIPFVLAYIVFAWRAIDRKRITQEEIEQGEAY